MGFGAGKTEYRARRRLSLVLLLAAALLCLFTPVSAEEAPPEDWGNSVIVDPFRSYGYEEMAADLAALAERYPALVSVGSIGQSAEGRDIPVLRLGRGERIVLMCAAIHAREFETTAFIMYMADQYCRGYVAGAEIGALSCRTVLDGVTFVIVPQLNPDGVEIARTGPDSVLTRPWLEALPISDGWYEGYYAWKSNARGVDLNRNWPYLWNNWDKCAEPASAHYAGPEPLSEPETQAMASLIAETPFWAFCSLHSAGNCVYWIDSSNSEALRDKLYPTARRVADGLSYRLLPTEDVSRFGGYMINCCRAAYEKPCMSVEIGPYTGHYPFRDYETFRWTAARALPLGLILGDEVLQTPEWEAPAAREIPGALAQPAEAPQPPAAPSAAEPERGGAEIRVVLDGAAVHFPDVTPLIENGRTLTPLRAVCEAAGLTVGWDGAAVTVTDGEHTAALTIGSDALIVDGAFAARLEAVPRIAGDRTLVPIRALMEAFGYDVAWDEAAKCVVIETREYC